MQYTTKEFNPKVIKVPKHGNNLTTFLPSKTEIKYLIKLTKEDATIQTTMSKVIQSGNSPKSDYPKEITTVQTTQQEKITKHNEI